MGTATLIPAAHVAAAAERLRGVAARTPLLPSPDLGDATGAEVRLKCDNLQRGGAFKIRGAYNLMAQLAGDVLARGVVAYSSGNHGQGVALAARLLGAPATVVLPVKSARVKRDGIARLGATLVLEGETSLERRRLAEDIARERRLTIVPGFDDPRIVAGQGTVGLEIAEDWPELDTALVPVGGGGLISGVAVALRARLPRVRIIGVEPVGAPSMRAALDADVPVTLEAPTTIADGLAATRVSDLTLGHVRELVDDIVQVPDEAMRAAAAFLLLRQKLLVEFSGAATVAALRSGAVDVRGRKVAAVLSGGNIDPSAVRSLVAHAALETV